MQNLLSTHVQIGFHDAGELNPRHAQIVFRAWTFIGSRRRIAWSSARASQDKGLILSSVRYNITLRFQTLCCGRPGEVAEVISEILQEAEFFSPCIAFEAVSRAPTLRVWRV